MAQTGLRGFNGDGIVATAAQLDAPFGVALDSAGNLLIADLKNGRIRLVFPDNVAPIANAGGPYSVNEGGFVQLNAGGSSDPDGDTLTFGWDLDYDGVTFQVDTVVVSPVVSAVGLGPHTRTIAVRVSDGSLSAIATTQLTVLNAAPVKVNNSYSTDEDVALNVAAPGVLSNDTDAFGSLTALLVSSTSNGSLSLNANGSFSYTPNTDFSGTDSFTYQAKDVPMLCRIRPR